jgi:uncharacterized protein (DUF433 family)/DNA-binding transcriptional MerR regulator
MAYPVKLTSILTGATPSQLDTWRRKGLIVPEIRAFRPPLYSFRDLVALRAMVFLRSTMSLQSISRAFANLDVFDLTDHPSTYRFGTDGRTIFVEHPDTGDAMDIYKRPGQVNLFPFDDIAGTFQNFREDTVAPFYRPAEHVELRPQRRGGWPTIADTRVDYDVIAQLVDGETITVEDVPTYYPTVSVEAAESAVEFDERIQAVKVG